MEVKYKEQECYIDTGSYKADLVFSNRGFGGMVS